MTVVDKWVTVSGAWRVSQRHREPGPHAGVTTQGYGGIAVSSILWPQAGEVPGASP